LTSPSSPVRNFGLAAQPNPHSAPAAPVAAPTSSPHRLPRRAAAAKRQRRQGPSLPRQALSLDPPAGDELPPELSTSQGRRGWLREAQRRLDDKRAQEARPVPRSRGARLKESKRRLEEELSPAVPFGGPGASGIGRESGHEPVREFTETKAVWVELTGATRDPFELG
jgi:hypothetical protein